MNEALLVTHSPKLPLLALNKGKEFLMFKSSPNGEWKAWKHLPPTKQTLEILKRESDATHLSHLKRYLDLKKEGKKPSMPIPHCIFYGEFIYAYRWARGREWNVEKGWVNE